MISLEKWSILTPLQKLPKNVADLGKFIVAKGFKKLSKVQNIAQSGHTDIQLTLNVQYKFLPIPGFKPRGPLELEATALPIESLPLSWKRFVVT